jgi:hypothetical protein
MPLDIASSSCRDDGLTQDDSWWRRMKARSAMSVCNEQETRQNLEACEGFDEGDRPRPQT